MSTPTAVLDVQETPTSTRWAGIIGIEGEPTGDGRLINLGALRWDILPVPLRFVSADVGAHDGAVVVGNIETVERRDGGVLWATGVFDDPNKSPQAAEAMRLVADHMMNGVSMDLDSVSFEVRVAQELINDEDPEDDSIVLAQETAEDGKVTVATIKSDDEVMVTTDGRVRASTLVAVPAFARANIYLEGDPTLEALVAAAGDAVAPAPEAPVATGDGQALWDEAIAQLTAVDQMEFLSPEYLAATDKAGDAFAAAAIALQTDDPARATQAAEVAAKLKRFASLPWGDPEDVQTRDSGPTADAPAADVQDILAAATQSITAAGAPIHPPEEWFADPQLDGPTPLVVTKEGRVYGHLATWDVCHVASPGGPGICITAPHSNRDYADFHTGTVLTAEDTLIGTGKITMGTGHAPHKMSANATAAHYDNTGTVIADIRAGEDMFGIWVAGALVPEATEAQARTLRSCPLSGDWREVAGSLELKAALAVPVPGFPIPRPAGLVASGGERLYALTASGMLAHDTDVEAKPEPGTDQLSAGDVDYLRRLIQRNRVQDAAVLASEVRTIRNRQVVAAFAHSRKA